MLSCPEVACPWPVEDSPAKQHPKFSQMLNLTSSPIPTIKYSQAVYRTTGHAQDRLSFLQWPSYVGYSPGQQVKACFHSAGLCYITFGQKTHHSQPQSLRVKMREPISLNFGLHSGTWARLKLSINYLFARCLGVNSSFSARFHFLYKCR